MAVCVYQMLELNFYHSSQISKNEENTYTTLTEVEAKVKLVVREKISNYHYLFVNQMLEVAGWCF
jgi:hypothetical protein